MSDLIQDTDCYILAGGKSSRMGTDKGLVSIDNKSLVEFVIRTVKPLFKNCFIVSKNPEYNQFELICIQDEVEGIGPAGGIYTAMRHCQSKKILIVSCDMPNITASAIKSLIASSKNYDIIVPVFEHKFEPLFAIYSKACAHKWRELINSEVYKLQNIISNFNTLELDVTKNPFFSKELFMNLNTQEELDQFARTLKNGH